MNGVDRVGASVQEFTQNIKKYAERRGFFLKMQFGFQEGVGRDDVTFYR